MKIEEYRQYLKENLSSKRFYHSECVEKEAVRLAVIFGADTQKTREAALLHDICKEMPCEEQLKYLKSCDILLCNVLLDNPFVWHGITGAQYIQKELAVTDNDIINAVRYHTTARAGMSLVEQMVFLADYTSEDRIYPDIIKIRDYVKISKELAIVKCLEYGLTKCLEANRALMQESLEAYNFYLDIIKKEGMSY